MRECDRARAYGIANIGFAVARDDDDFARSRSQQIIDATGDEALIAKRQELFELAHSP